MEILKTCLLKAGLTSLPEDPHAALADYGFDSLAQAMALLEIEKAFAVRLPYRDLKPDTLRSLSSLATWIDSVKTQR